MSKTSKVVETNGTTTYWQTADDARAWLQSMYRVESRAWKGAVSERYRLVGGGTVTLYY